MSKKISKSNRYRLRKEAVNLFEQGCGYRVVARNIGVSTYTVRRWYSTYYALGKDVLLNMGKQHMHYDFETKVQVVRSVVEDGLTQSAAMRRFGIVNIHQVKQWCRLYREGGIDALRPKSKGRPKTSAQPKPQKREEELERYIHSLEAEIAYLKKSIALKAKKNSQIERKR